MRHQMGYHAKITEVSSACCITPLEGDYALTASEAYSNVRRKRVDQDH